MTQDPPSRQSELWDDSCTHAAESASTSARDVVSPLKLFHGQAKLQHPCWGTRTCFTLLATGTTAAHLSKKTWLFYRRRGFQTLTRSGGIRSGRGGGGWVEDSCHVSVQGVAAAEEPVCCALQAAVTRPQRGLSLLSRKEISLQSQSPQPIVNKEHPRQCRSPQPTVNKRNLSPMPISGTPVPAMKVQCSGRIHAFTKSA